MAGLQQRTLLNNLLGQRSSSPGSSMLGLPLSELPPGPLLKRDFSALMPNIDPEREPTHSQSRATRMLSVPTGSQPPPLAFVCPPAAVGVL